MSVLILATGGTLDKVHDPIHEDLGFPETSLIPDILKQGKVTGIEVKTLMLKDSLEMDDTDRQIICDAILASEHDRIIITHGTSTMSDTAEYLKDRIQNKTIVLTGAMRPFSLYESDAKFNLGGAVIAAQTLGQGTYIVMNGHVFPAGQVRKNTQTGVFEGKAGM